MSSDPLTIVLRRWENRDRDRSHRGKCGGVTITTVRKSPPADQGIGPWKKQTFLPHGLAIKGTLPNICSVRCLFLILLILINSRAISHKFECLGEPRVGGSVRWIGRWQLQVLLPEGWTCSEIRLSRHLSSSVTLLKRHWLVQYGFAQQRC